METLLNMNTAKRRKRNIGKHFSERVLGSTPGIGVDYRRSIWCKNLTSRHIYYIDAL